MQSATPKVLHPVAGMPMVGHVLDAVAPLCPAAVVVVVGQGHSAVQQYVAGRSGHLEWPCVFATQTPPLGTGDGVRVGFDALRGAPSLNPNDQGMDDDTQCLILFGDTPLVRVKTLGALLQTANQGADICVCAMTPSDPKTYGRLVCDGDGELLRIVEYKDASQTERSIPLCNGGVMLVRASVLKTLLPRIVPSPETGEYYLTDLIALGRAAGLRVTYHVAADADEFEGVNTRSDLATAEGVMQQRLRDRMMAAGVTLIDPPSVTLCHDTVLGRDCVVEPFVVFGPQVVGEEGVRIKSFSYLEGAHLAHESAVGPFARLRPQTSIGPSARVGNFVEIKASTLKAGAKVGHLSYVGDSMVGTHTNVGAGVITCNYDGFQKHPTHLGDRVFVGSNTSLIAPVRVGDGAIVGAGSVVSTDVAADSLTLSRPPLQQLENGAKRYRERRGRTHLNKKG